MNIQSSNMSFTGAKEMKLFNKYLASAKKADAFMLCNTAYNGGFKAMTQDEFKQAQQLAEEAKKQIEWNHINVIIDESMKYIKSSIGL